MNVKVTVNINEAIWDRFIKMVEKEELTRTYAINEALSDWEFFERAIRNGKKDIHPIIRENKRDKIERRE